MKKLLICLTLTLIVLGAGFLRVYKLDSVPPSLNWDEVAAGYNAYTIANWGRDEWGQKFPLVFTSFKDDKHPVHIYITAVFVKFMGLSDFSARLPSAIIGTLTVLTIFFLGSKLFNSKAVGFFASIFLAVSPYHLQFSRGLWESNFALFFFILGLTLFFYGIDAIGKKKWLLPISVLSFGLSFFSYHSSKVLVPPTLLLLFILEYKKLIANKKILISVIFVIFIFTFLTIKEPRILGLARVNQNKFSDDLIEQTSLFKKYGNKTIGYINLVANNYIQYFNLNYLFINGDQSPRNSVKVVGEFYKIEGILLIPGLFMLIKKRSKKILILLSWLLLAPIAGALSSTDVNANRAIFMSGSIDIVSAAGATYVLGLFNNKFYKLVIIATILFVLSLEFYQYIKYYYTKYSQKDAIEWQYGMEQSVKYIAKRNDIDKVYVDKIRQQPYIFFLFYLKTPLPELLRTVKYDKSQSSSYNTVLSFDNYQFGGWDPIESYPSEHILYVLTPSYYSGLRYINEFSVDKLIKYPSDSDAFYIVEGDR